MSRLEAGCMPVSFLLADVAFYALLFLALMLGTHWLCIFMHILKFHLTCVRPGLKDDFFDLAMYRCSWSKGKSCSA